MSQSRAHGATVLRPNRAQGVQKAAVLLVSLGPQHAAAVLRHLRQGEIEAISLEMAKLQQIDVATSDAVLHELAATVGAYEALAVGGVEYAREVLERALGTERADEIVGRLASVIENRPFEFLGRTPAERIATFLQHESPQTAALVVAYLPTPLAAEVLNHLPAGAQADIGMRIATLGEPTAEVVRQVEELMRQKLGSIRHHEAISRGGVESLADIINHVDRSTETNVMESLEVRDGEVAAELRRLLFTFEDITKLDDRAMQRVLREADPKDLALALRAASNDVRERILGNMSQRGARMLIDDIEHQPPQRKRVVEEAQGRIVAIVRRLEHEGTIVIARGDDDIVL